jgi:hypothetical protein
MSPPAQQQQQQLANKLNAVLDSLACDADCQRERDAAASNQRLADATEVHMTSAKTLQDAQRESCVQKHGEDKCDVVMQKKHVAMGAEAGEKINQVFDREFEMTHRMLDTYRAAIANTENTRALGGIVAERAETAQVALAETVGEADTNDRTAYYEWKKVDAMRWRYSAMYWTFYVFAISLAAYTLSTRAWSPQNIVPLIALMLYPMVVPPVVGWLWSTIFFPLGTFVFNMLPIIVRGE